MDMKAENINWTWRKLAEGKVEYTKWPNGIKYPTQRTSGKGKVSCRLKYLSFQNINKLYDTIVVSAYQLIRKYELNKTCNSAARNQTIIYPRRAN